MPTFTFHFIEQFSILEAMNTVWLAFKKAQLPALSLPSSCTYVFVCWSDRCQTSFNIKNTITTSLSRPCSKAQWPVRIIICMLAILQYQHHSYRAGGGIWTSPLLFCLGTVAREMLWCCKHLLLDSCFGYTRLTACLRADVFVYTYVFVDVF